MSRALKEKLQRCLSFLLSTWWIWLLIILLGSKGLQALTTQSRWLDIKPQMTPLPDSAVLHHTEETLSPITLTPSPAPTPPGPEDLVYITESGKAYHADPTCSRMKSPQAITRQEAEAMGRTPCSRCIPSMEDATP